MSKASALTTRPQLENKCFGLLISYRYTTTFYNNLDQGIYILNASEHESKITYETL